MQPVVLKKYKVKRKEASYISEAVSNFGLRFSLNGWKRKLRNETSRETKLLIAALMEEPDGCFEVNQFSISILIIQVFLFWHILPLRFPLQGTKHKILRQPICLQVKNCQFTLRWKNAAVVLEEV